MWIGTALRVGVLGGQSRGILNVAQALVAGVAAGLLALGFIRVRQQRRLRAGLCLAGASILTLYATGVVTGFPDPQRVVEQSADALGAWAYPVVAGMAFFETGLPPFTVIFPGEWGVAFGGLLARRGVIDLIPLIGVVWVASLVGDSWSFYLGRRFGRSYLIRHGLRFGVTHERLDALDAFFARWGAATVALGRLVPFARPFVPLVAGASDWPYRRFLPYDVVGTGVFAIAFTLLGYLAYATAERVVEIGGDAALIGVPVVLAGVVLAVIIRRRMTRRRPALT